VIASGHLGLIEIEGSRAYTRARYLMALDTVVIDGETMLVELAVGWDTVTLFFADRARVIDGSARVELATR
jgi:hypothetical protein